MNQTWSDPGITPQDLQEFLQALALSEHQNAPLVALAGDDAGKPRLVAASETFFQLFGAQTPGALAARLLGTGDPGGKRLLILFQMLPLEGPPRLERLRFLIGDNSEVVTFLCRRLAVRGRNILIAAALGLKPGLLPPPALHALPAPPAAVIPSPVPPVPSQPAARAPAAGARDAAGVRAHIARKYPNLKTLRFLWRSDASSVCTSVTPPLAEAVGERAAAIVGKNLLELAPALDPTGTLDAYLRSQSTWSSLRLQWPVTDAAAQVPVVLGAIPAFTPEREFDGFHGFGVIHLDSVTEAPAGVVTPWAEPLAAREAEIDRNAAPEEVQGALNVVQFPSRPLSKAEQAAFETIGAVLRTGDIPPADDLPAAAPVAPAPREREAPGSRQSLEGTKRAEDAEAIARRDDIEPRDDTEPRDDIAPPEDMTPALSGTNNSRNQLAILDKLTTGLLVTRNNIPIFANRHILDMLGFANEDQLHDAGGMTHLFGGLPGNTTGSEAVGIRARDGTVRAVNARVQAVEWDGLPATLLTIRDVSPPIPSPRDAELRRQQESELRELRAILETATDGVAVLDANGHVLSLNRSGEALFGCDRAVVIGEPFLTLFAPHNQSLAAEYFEGLKSSATKSLLNDGREILVKAHRGGTIPVFMTLGRLGPADVGPQGHEPAGEARYCALFRDLTHWKKVEQELDHARQDAERTSALKSDFLAKVSHEVRTPLNAIIGFAEVIMEERFGPVGNARYKDYLKDIHTSGTHVMSLINDLLDLSKIEAGKMELTAASIDANKIITECTGIMQPQASQERVIMRLSLSPSLPRIKADERSLRQIVLNLLSNAVKFNEPGGQVIIATALTDSGHVVIRIRDTGPGMSESDIAAALEPFRQLATSRPMTAGTGLGLPLTKALVEANHAAFTLRSKLDQGTMAEVAFPPALVLAE